MAHTKLASTIKRSYLQSRALNRLLGIKNSLHCNNNILPTGPKSKKKGTYSSDLNLHLLHLPTHSPSLSWREWFQNIHFQFEILKRLILWWGLVLHWEKKSQCIAQLKVDGTNCFFHPMGLLLYIQAGFGLCPVPLLWALTCLCFVSKVVDGAWWLWGQRRHMPTGPHHVTHMDSVHLEILGPQQLHLFPQLSVAGSHH